MNRRMRFLLLTSLVGAALLLPATGFAQKVGVVDMGRALNETEHGRRAKSKLEKLFAKRQKSFADKQNKLKQLKDSIEKQQAVLERSVLAKKVEQYQKAVMELQGTYMEFQRELQAKEAELTKDILKRMKAIMKRIGQKEGYAIILERAEAGVIYIPSSYDLTDILIQRYNAENRGKGGKKKKKKKKK